MELVSERGMSGSASGSKPVLHAKHPRKLYRDLEMLEEQELEVAKDLNRAIEHAKASYSNVELRDALPLTDKLLHSGIQFRGIRGGKDVYVVVTETENITRRWCRDLNDRARSAGKLIHVVPTRPQPEHPIVAYVTKQTGWKPNGLAAAVIGLIMIALFGYVGSEFPHLVRKLPEWFKDTHPAQVAVPVRRDVATSASSSLQAASASGTTTREPIPSSASSNHSLDVAIQDRFRTGVLADSVIRHRFGGVVLSYDGVDASPLSEGVWSCGLTARVVAGNGEPVVFDEHFSITDHGTRISVCEQVAGQVVSRLSSGARD